MSEKRKRISKRQYDEFLKIIGKIVVIYSSAELSCCQIVDFLSRKKEGMKIYKDKSLNAEKKIKSLKACVVKQGSIPQRRAFLSMLGKLDESRKERNDLAHSIWVRDHKVGSMQAIKTNRSTGALTLISYTNSNLKAILDRLEDNYNDISDLWLDLLIEKQTKGL